MLLAHAVEVQADQIVQLISPDAKCLPPQPLILDPKLRFPTSSRILQEWNTRATRAEVVRQPWIICGSTVPSSRIEEVQEAGARVIPVELDSQGKLKSTAFGREAEGTGRIAPNALPAILTQLGLRSVMIEGGSKILSSFLRAPNREDGSPLVDGVIVTVAPMFIGEGVGVIPDVSRQVRLGRASLMKQDEGVNMPELETIHTETMGKDAVMVCRVKS